MKKTKSIEKAIKELEGIKNMANLVPLQNQVVSIIGEDRKNITLISSNYDELDSPNEILETYLKILVSLLPDIELLCKQKVSEYSIRALTMLGDSLRQTITELEVYKDPNAIIDERVTPSIQMHHDEVVRKIAEHVSRMKNSLFELFPPEKHSQAQNLLIEFLKTLGEDLRITYTHTAERIREDLLGIRGLG